MSSNAVEINQSKGEFTEQSASMMQQLATSQIQSRYQIARRFPRDPDMVRQKMLAECDRPGFFAPDDAKNGSSVAIYRVPRAGTNIEDVTIRFAEMAMRCHGNMSTDIVALGEDEQKSLYHVSCTDYETNNTHTEIVIVPRTIQRNYIKDTDTVVSTSTNSKSKVVYTIIGGDDELQNKRNALFSKAKRNLIKAQIDQGVVEECKFRLKANAAKKDAADPEAAKKNLYDGFASIGVTAIQLNEYLGHSNKLSPAELEELRGFYAGIAQGYTTWKEIMSSKEGADEGTEQQDTLKKTEALFTELEMPIPTQRKHKAKYAANPKGLLEWLESEVAKKRNDGSKKPEAATEATKEADTASSGKTQQEQSGNTSVESRQPTTASTETVSSTKTQPTSQVLEGESRREFEADRTQGTGGSKKVEPEPEPLSTEGW